ncbi:MAG: SRPBCC domain-containing protein [Gemmatimonadaceae bacterium]
MTQPKPLPDQVLSVEINAPIQKVWNEITKTGAIQRALNNTVLESTMRPGAKLRYYSPSRKRVFVVGEIVDLVAPTKFAHTWKFTMNPEAFTLVTWELSELPGGSCRVTLTHSRWTDDMKSYKNVSTTWTGILRLLKLDLETGTIDLKTRMIYGMFGALEFMLPKTTSVPYADQQGW